MQTQNGGRPTILPKMYEEPLFSQIIDKIESGCNDREIYTSLHCSAKTFRKWRDDNIKAYDEAKSIARGNLLELAESALASKLTVRTLKETETIYDADGNIEKVKVKEKELDKDRKEVPYDVIEQVNINIKYEGYLKRQQQQVAQFKKLEKKKLDPDFDYSSVNSLRREAVQKLNLYKPVSIGQASRISGVSPADISVLLVHLEQMRHSK